MKKFLQTHKNYVIGIAISMITFIVFSLVYTQSNLLDGLENGSINFRFFLRDPSEKSKKLQEGVKITKPNPRARKDIMIIGLDENTTRKFTEQGIVWPYPWNMHAKFTKFIGSGNPKAIFFDIMFLDHKKHEDELAEALKEARVAFLDFPFETEEVDVKYADIKERMEILNRIKWPADPADTSPKWVDEAVPPTPKLAGAAKGIGYANIRPDSDSINRKLPLIVKFNNAYYPSIDLVLTMHFFGIESKDVEIRMGKYVKLKNLPADKMAKPNPEREILIPIDDKGFMDINFIGGPGSFGNISYYYFVKDGKDTSKSLENKILLVAAYSVTGVATDIHKSPYGDLFGIEHHANALNTILNQDFIIKFSEMENLLILFVIAVLMGFTVSKFSIVKSTIVTFLLSIVYLVAAYLLFDKANVIVIFATPVIQVFSTFTVITVYRVLTEQQEKKYIRQTFSKFVSKSVVDELLQDPEKLKLGGEKKILTVLFSDIRGFTSISEKLSPEALVEHLNEYLEAMTELVFKYDGTLDKYVGDEIMAFWGAPIPQDNHAILASKCAVEMMAKLNELNAKWTHMGKPELHIGIGLNTGDMVVGNMGSSSRMDYTLMGDNVNLGARLEGTNKVYKTDIIISEYTYEHVKDQVIIRELDLIRVKGKQLPVKIYELVDIK